MVRITAEDSVVYGSGRCQSRGLCCCLDEGRSEYLVDDYCGIAKREVEDLVRAIRLAMARDEDEGVKGHLQRLVLPWPKRTRRIVRTLMTGVHEDERTIPEPTRAKKRPREEGGEMSLPQLQQMCEVFGVRVCTTKQACKRRIEHALQQQREAAEAVAEAKRLEEKRKEEERLKMEREVRETLEKELRARLKEEAEQMEKDEAREAELSGSLAGIRQKPCRHGYQCRLFWVSWSHCAKFHHPSNMGVWDAKDP